MTQIAQTGAGATSPPVIVWITEDTWSGCVDAARTLAPAQAPIVLLHVTPGEVAEAAHSAYAGLLGRGRPGRDPGERVEDLAAASAAELLDAAEQRLARPCERMQRRGRVEREVVAAAAGAGLLIVARDGDRTHLGPRSLGRAGRFIVDHAPCPVLLIWPEEAPGVAAIPPPPPRHPQRKGPQPKGSRPRRPPAPTDRAPAHRAGPRER